MNPAGANGLGNVVDPAVMRILDANLNRGREALRVMAAGPVSFIGF